MLSALSIPRFLRQVCFSGYSNRIGMSTDVTIDPSRNITYEKFSRLLNNGSSYIIDVREKKELEDTGVIPHSVNIPVGEVESALSLSSDEFEKKYGKRKPDADTTIIFSCRSGKRSTQALSSAAKLGYTNCFNYIGGWLDYENNMKQNKL